MTQLEMARRGFISEEVKWAAHWEGVLPSELSRRISRGTVVLPKNIHHELPYSYAIGQGLKTKVNANIGISEENSCLQSELEKMERAIASGAHALMDLSIGKDLDSIRREIILKSPVMVGTVPVYSLVSRKLEQGEDLRDLSSRDFIDELENHGRSGVDFITVHGGVTSFSVQQLKNSNRTLGMVSRGGALIKRWMEETGQENPYYNHFDQVLDICRAHDITLSLGDGLRPGAIHDAGDRAQMAELVILGDLAQRSRKSGVQVMIEGPGHVPYEDIAMHIKMMKRLCDGAPCYVLGPLPTDIAAGHDHITAAIGGSSAAVNGADFLCYVTPAEHLTLPNCQDVHRGVMATRIAAHIGDLSKGLYDETPDHRISKARRDLNWQEIFKYSLDKEESKARRGSIEKDCAMCGGLCAIRNDKGE